MAHARTRAEMETETAARTSSGAKKLAGDGYQWTLRRLVAMVILILRTFRVSLTSLERRISTSSTHSKSTGGARSPTKSHSKGARRQPSLLELSQPESWLRLNRSVQQRLQYPPQPTTHTCTAEQQSVLSGQVRDILYNSSWTRTPQQVEQIVQELQLCRDFKDYLMHIQHRLCKVGWYLCLEHGRVVYREGQQANCFYFLLSGNVNVANGGDNRLTLTAGGSFGEQEIIDGCCRTMTCTVKDSAELLVISKSDYLDLSLRQASLTYQKKKHFEFCKSVAVLRYWPVHLLETRPDQCKLNNYKTNTVVVKDSRKSPWVYVVMTGSCRVVKRFVDGGEYVRSRKHHQTHPPDFPTSKLALAGESSAARQPATETLAQRTLSLQKQTPLPQELRGRKSHVRSHHLHAATAPQAVPERPFQLSQKKQFLVQLQLLQPKDTFGLSSIVYPDEASVTLVSNGAEVIMVSKEFILLHLNETIRNKLKRQITQFPSQEAMLKRIRDHFTWNMYRQTMVTQNRKRV